MKTKMANMKLICETLEDVHFVQESVEAGSKKNTFLEGVFMQAEIVNRNGRKYPLPVMESAVSKYIAEKINKKCAYGELDHPAGPTVNLKNVAIHIKGLVREGNNFVGKALVASTPQGDIVRGLLADGANLGVSSRALGSLKPSSQGYDLVEDLIIRTAADVVADPSAHLAFVRGIMENVDYIYDASREAWLEEKLDETKKTLKKVSVKQMEEMAETLFNNFLNDLNKQKY